MSGVEWDGVLKVLQTRWVYVPRPWVQAAGTPKVLTRDGRTRTECDVPSKTWTMDGTWTDRKGPGVDGIHGVERLVKDGGLTEPKNGGLTEPKNGAHRAERRKYPSPEPSEKKKKTKHKTLPDFRSTRHSDLVYFPSH